MKKVTVILTLSLLCSASLSAQTYLDVNPGYGTLNAAIAANQGNVVYRLQAGQWYGLNGVIENNGFPLTIVGTTPAPGQMPAEIQTGTNTDGTVLQDMFNAIGDLTLKDVFIVNANSLNSVGADLITVASTTPVDVVLDSVTCDPVGTAEGTGFAAISFGNTPHPNLFITNSQFLRCGTLDGANDGDLIGTGGATNNGFDTLYIENNTFVSTGTWFWRAGLANRDSENFVWINHNTFVFHKSQLAWSWLDNQYYVTNNLFFDFTTQPWEFAWNVYFPDGDTTGPESWMALVNQDTASSDSVTTAVGDSAGMKFTSDSSFTGVMINCPTWGNASPTRSLTMKLYKWNTDYATTVSEAPIADTTFVNFSDNAYLWLNFKPQPAGLYCWQVSSAEGIAGIWAYDNAKDTVTSYFDGQDVDTNNYICQIQYVGGTTPALTNAYGSGTVPYRINPIGTASGILSKRKLFVEYNSFYTDPSIQAYTTTWAATHTLNNDGVTPLGKAYIMHLMYPGDSASVNREAAMCGSSSFPYFKEGNYMDNLIGINPPSTDPQWTDQALYSIQDSLVAWTLPAAELNTWGFAANSVNPQPSAAPNWFWCADTTYNYGNPEVWPRINCAYKNPEMLTASIEGLPLGDLNWFPAQKAIWQQNQASIMAHILGEDTSQVTLTAVTQESNPVPSKFKLSQNYPNPFNPTTKIQYSIARSSMVTLNVYNVLGEKVATLVNQRENAGNYVVNFDASRLASGVYLYRIQAGDYNLTRKMILLK